MPYRSGSVSVVADLMPQEIEASRRIPVVAVCLVCGGYTKSDIVAGDVLHLESMVNIVRTYHCACEL